MKLRTYRFKCAVCDHFDVIMFDLDEEDSDAMQDCPMCNTEKAYGKILYITQQGANTEKTSETIPAGVRKFSNKREQRKLENTIRHAKARGDTDTVIEASKESLERGMISKGVADTPTTRQLIKGKKK